MGQVYARHLQRGGAEVGVFVREKYAEGCRAGLPMYPLNGPAGRYDLTDLTVCTTPEQVAATRWDQLWICVSSTGLRGDWLPPLLAAAPTATVVTLQPGLEDRALLLEHVAADRLVTGLITFIAWQAPLPGEDAPDPPGIMYWLPPLVSVPFSGPAHRVLPLTEVLRRGGMRARTQDDLPAQMAVSAAAMSPAMAALETAGWSLAAFRRGDAAALGAAAGRQSMLTAAAYHNRPPPAAARLLWPLTLRLIALVGPRVVPFDLETYLRYHFTKVGDQTRSALRTTLRQARENRQPHDAVERLLAALGEQP